MPLFMLGGMPAPFIHSAGLGLYVIVLHGVSSLRLTQILGGCCLHDKVRLILRLFMRIVNPEMAFGRLEPFQVILFIFVQNGEPAF